MTITRHPLNQHMSASVEHNGVVYLCGFTAHDKSARMHEQAQQVLERIDAALAEAGTDKSKLLTATIYLTDLSYKPVVNEVWEAWIDANDKPTRATVGAMLDGGALIEIVVSAAK